MLQQLHNETKLEVWCTWIVVVKLDREVKVNRPVMSLLTSPAIDHRVNVCEYESLGNLASNTRVSTDK